MQEDKIIQKNLFSFDNAINQPTTIKEISSDLSNEELKKESDKRPRQRKGSTNLLNKFKTESVSYTHLTLPTILLV